MKYFIDKRDPDVTVRVWEATVYDPDAHDSIPWTFHVLALSIQDALTVAQRHADLVKRPDQDIVTEVKMIGAYGVYAAPTTIFDPEIHD